jgi:serine/threonine protein kinase
LPCTSIPDHEPLKTKLIDFLRDSFDEKCIVKSVHGHWRLQNEAKILNHYQSKTRHLRPLLDEILPEDPADPPSIVLRHLDSELLTESNNKRLTRPEIKQVARGVLEALRVLHKDGMVHTGTVIGTSFFFLAPTPGLSEV